MRAHSLLIAAAVALSLAGCSFEDPPAPTPGAGGSQPAGGDVPAVPPPSGDLGPCTAFALTLLDGQLNGLPSATPEEADKANKVVERFVARYDQVIVASGVPVARERYTQEVAAACGE